MQTVSKYGAAADAEAQAPAAPERKALGRAKVASICLAAALSGAAVASVARVRTRTYVADLYADLGGTFTGPDQINMKLCGDLGKVCPGTTRCYEKRKNDGARRQLKRAWSLISDGQLSFYQKRKNFRGCTSTTMRSRKKKWRKRKW